MRSLKELLDMIPSPEEKVEILAERKKKQDIEESEAAAKMKTKFLENVEGALIASINKDFRVYFKADYMGTELPKGVVQGLEVLKNMGFKVTVVSPENQMVHLITIEA